MSNIHNWLRTKCKTLQVMEVYYYYYYCWITIISLSQNATDAMLFSAQFLQPYMQ